MKSVLIFCGLLCAVYASNFNLADRSYENTDDWRDDFIVKLEKVQLLLKAKKESSNEGLQREIEKTESKLDFIGWLVGSNQWLDGYGDERTQARVISTLEKGLAYEFDYTHYFDYDVVACNFDKHNIGDICLQVE